MKRYKLLTIFAVVCLVVGFVSLFLAARAQTAIATALPTSAEVKTAKAAAPQPAASPALVQGNPVRLVVPSLSIDLAITPGVYNATTKAWTLTTDKVQYAVMTSEPNNMSGNTFLYGHYRKDVLATLHNIQPGAFVQVHTDSGKVFTYQLADVQVTDPSDPLDVFSYQGSPRLTIQTCTGMFMQNRQLFTFNYVGVE